jgi:hypothetical protein
MECLKNTISIKTIKYRLLKECGITFNYRTKNRFDEKVWADKTLDTTILISQKTDNHYIVVCDVFSDTPRCPRSITNHRELSEVINWYNSIYDDQLKHQDIQ